VVLPAPEEITPPADVVAPVVAGLAVLADLGGAGARFAVLARLAAGAEAPTRALTAHAASTTRAATRMRRLFD